MSAPIEIVTSDADGMRDFPAPNAGGVIATDRIRAS